MRKSLHLVLLLPPIFFGCVKAPPDSGNTTSLATVDRIQYAWVGIGPGHRLIARAVTDEKSGAIPSISVDGGRAQPMKLRVASNGDFPIRIYEFSLALNAKRARITQKKGNASQTVDLKLLPGDLSELDRIVVLGDTGCRLKGDYCQDCGDPEKWPFQQVADRAAKDPDLVISVGDYHYREFGCDCDTNPEIACGDNWAAWEADFFEPAKTLLGAAPWIFVRGNHEICDGRAGEGWTRLLDPHPYESCASFKDPYQVDLGPVRFLVLDVADTDSRELDEGQLPRLESFFSWVGETATEPSVLLTHQPIWNLYPNGGTANATLQKALETALNNQLPAAVKLVIAGHDHLFRWMDFHQSGSIRRAPQFIIGNGGTELDSDEGVVLAGRTVGEVEVRSGDSDYDNFGFCIFNPSPDPWIIDRYDLEGNKVESLGVRNNQVFKQPD